MIFDKTRNIPKVLSLFGILGGSVTIFGSMSTIQTIDIPLWKFIFIGEAPNYLMFSSHYLILLISLIVILNSKKFTKWSFLGENAFILSYIVYILIVSSVYKIECNTTGIRVGDWINPYQFFDWYAEYGFLNKLLELAYPFNVVFWYFISYIIVVIMMSLKNILTKQDCLSNYKIWWCKLSKIDSFLNKINFKIEFKKKDFYFI